MALKILSVVGARPNFMKIAAICEAINAINTLAAAERIRHVLVHTGQHYDSNMSDSFLTT
jgi:UDP-N-acetylglucosamine 2-epimerase